MGTCMHTAQLCVPSPRCSCSRPLQPLLPFSSQQLEEEDVDSLAIVAVAGISAEGQAYEEVMGQTGEATPCGVGHEAGRG